MIGIEPALRNVTDMNSLAKTIKSLQYLGFKKIWFFALYQAGLFSGYFHRLTPNKRAVFSGKPSLPPYQSFPKIDQIQKEHLLSEADQVRKGTIQLFGVHRVPFDVKVGASDKHWSELAKIQPKKDIKFIWEPGRFGWAITLARAYAVSEEDLYAQDFWEKTLAFLEAHPPNIGRQWQSAQEVAIRLMVLVYCDRVFANAPSSTPERRRRLWQALVEHARRIPPTLVYARAQNNNHLLSEAAGLYTAGLYLKEHSEAQKWRQMSWRWINRALQKQIDEFGSYVQHSTNYHRLMLQLALFVDHLQHHTQQKWPPATAERLQAATRWLWGLTDPKTGLVPNLGANDGAYLFPLTQQPYQDYRPVVDAASKAFLEMDVYQQPTLAEMACWFEIGTRARGDQKQPQTPDMLRVKNQHGRAFIHTAHFKDRPSHADQLHVDLWRQGENIALDPGTFQYNAPSPWDNALATARVHNTLTFDGQDQMSRAGRFLWLDWAQAKILGREMGANGTITGITAEHDGFRKLGGLHQRTLKAEERGWIIEDQILSIGKAAGKIHQATIDWLLPDWKWRLVASDQLELLGPHFAFKLLIEGVVKISLFRAGERLIGDTGNDPTWGWVSPAYALKQPALMVKGTASGTLPISIRSVWQFE